MVLRMTSSHEKKKNSLFYEHSATKLKKKMGLQYQPLGYEGWYEYCQQIYHVFKISVLAHSEPISREKHLGKCQKYQSKASPSIQFCSQKFLKKQMISSIIWGNRLLWSQLVVRSWVGLYFSVQIDVGTISFRAWSMMVKC